MEYIRFSVIVFSCNKAILHLDALFRTFAFVNLIMECVNTTAHNHYLVITVFWLMAYTNPSDICGRN